MAILERVRFALPVFFTRNVLVTVVLPLASTSPKFSLSVVLPFSSTSISGAGAGPPQNPKVPPWRLQLKVPVTYVRQYPFGNLQ